MRVHSAAAAAAAGEATGPPNVTGTAAARPCPAISQPPERSRRVAL